MKKTKVITAGPDIRSEGGISAVLRTYASTIAGFRFLPTNSRRGSVAGAFVLGLTLARLPFYRLAGYNILHAHGASGKSFFRKKIVMGWARRLGFRTIFHNHGGGFKDFAGAHKDTVSRALGKCSAVIALTDDFNSFFTEQLGCRRVYTLPNPVELPTVAPDITKVSEGVLDILFLGKICRQKGVFDLLDALAGMDVAVRANVCVHIAGKGDVDDLLSRIDSLRLNDTVVYEGSVAGRSKDALLRRCRLMVLPSYIEGLPITLLEAGAYSMAAVATKTGGIPQLIKDNENGTLIDAGDVAALSAAIGRYACDRAAVQAHGVSARRLVEPYSASAVAQRLESIYYSLL